MHVMSILIMVSEADFVYLKEKTGASAGNLSVQLNKLKDAGYIKIEKKLKGNYPQTICSVSQKGIKAFEEYINTLKTYLNL